MAVKTILITGGSRGIGKASAELLKKEGYQVLAPSSKELDVGCNDSVKKYFTANFKADSKLYALVCNAGIFHSESLEKHSLDDWEEVLNVNLTGTFRACQAALPYLRNNAMNLLENSSDARLASSEQTELNDASMMAAEKECNAAGEDLRVGSRIIMISSVSAEGEAFAPAYTASKAGVNGLCKALAYELGSDKINVNAIAPGWVKTDMAQGILHTKELEADNLGATLQNRWIEPSEVAGLIKYLLSPEAKAITGQILTIDAGL